MKLIVTTAFVMAALPALFGQTTAVLQDGPMDDGSKDYIVVFKDKTATSVPYGLQHLRQRATYRNVPAMAVRLNPYELKQTRANPEVDYVAPDRPLRASGNLIAQTINATNPPSGQPVWQYGPGGFSGNTGQGIGVAVIDSGIDNIAQDFGNVAGQLGPNSRIVYAEDFLVPPGPNGQYGPNATRPTTHTATART
jgi:hypothetical protein